MKVGLIVGLAIRPEKQLSILGKYLYIFGLVLAYSSFATSFNIHRGQQ